MALLIALAWMQGVNTSPTGGVFATVAAAASVGYASLPTPLTI
jgi:hypothetical protein